MIKHKTTILLTGGAGFVGYNMYKQLSKTHNVIIVDNCSCNNSKINEKYLKNKILKIDLTLSIATVLKKLKHIKQIDEIWHFAAYPDVYGCEQNPLIATTQNIEMTKNIIKIAKKYTVSKLIFASTSNVYGNREHCLESNDVCPLNIYAMTKVISEKLLLTSKLNTKIYIFRYANIFGQYGYAGLIFDLYKKIKAQQQNICLRGKGQNYRAYIHIDDVVKQTINIVKTETAGIYNIGNNIAYSVKEIAILVKKIMKSKKEIIFDLRENNFDLNIVTMNLSKSSKVNRYKQPSLKITATKYIKFLNDIKIKV